MESVLEILYEAYSESRMADSPSIREGYRKLGIAVQTLPLKDNDAIMDAVCLICTAHERQAFLHGIRTGARLREELGK